MADGTKVEWTDATWNPVTGCTKVSAGCKHCYGARMAQRLRGRCGYPADEPFAVTLHPDRLDQPLRWRKPRRVFVCSMSDIFHEDVPDEFRTAVWATMAEAEQHTFQVLTKRPRLMHHWLTVRHAGAEPLPNVWLGVTAEDQAAADERVPLLLQTPAAVRFVSCEPLLGPVDLEPALHPGICMEPEDTWAAETLDWVIAGAETGPGARPMQAEWARSLQDQCEVAGVPFFFKKDSNGELPPDMPRQWPKVQR